MNILLRFIPLLVALMVFYPIAVSMASLSVPIKFPLATFMALCFGYANTWFNVYMDRRDHGALQPRTRGTKVLGHVLMAASAVMVGYGFALNHKLVLIASIACMLVADNRLTPQPVRAPAQKRPKRILPTVPGELTPQEQAVLATALQEGEKNPAAGVFFGSKVVLKRLTDMMAEKQPPHVESLLCALGALAGYSCQASLREYARNRGLEETAPFMVARTADGAKYFFGDALNEVLAEYEVSVWNLAAAAARDAGCKELPDMNEIFSHVTSTVGHQNFGIPRVPAKHAPKAPPLQMLKSYWPILGPLGKKFCASPGELPILFSRAIQDVIVQNRVPPRIAFLLAVESAIPMSKIDFDGAKDGS